jgi:hypothetical protein
MSVAVARIERGEPGWQGTAWFLERCYPKRFSKPELQLAQQINVGSDGQRCGVQAAKRDGPISAARSTRSRPVRVMTRGFCDMLSDLYDRTHGAEWERALMGGRADCA